MAFSMKQNNLFIMAKQTAIAVGRTLLNSKTKKSLSIEFSRFGEKGKPKTKETFWITIESFGIKNTLNALSIDDLKKMVELAEQIVESVDEKN